MRLPFLFRKRKGKEKEEEDEEEQEEEAEEENAKDAKEEEKEREKEQWDPLDFVRMPNKNVTASMPNCGLCLRPGHIFSRG